MKQLENLPPIARPLLNWYRKNRRILPFREQPSPYRIWVSEIMLQQTRMTAVIPYFERFTSALPDLASLAMCDQDRLHKLWEGLGYYNRVRNMQKAAQLILEEFNGELPADYTQLCSLPGIGPYTAGAIASIAFNLPVVAVDGNVLRVTSRLLAYSGDIGNPDVKKLLSEQIQKAQPADAPGDFNQAVMELGALVCTPGTPLCTACPLAGLCKAEAQGIAASLPYKAPKKPKVLLPVGILVVRCGDLVLLHKRPAGGLLAGMWEPVTIEGKPEAEEAKTKLSVNQFQEQLNQLFPQGKLIKPLPSSRHIFTHKIWQMDGWLAEIPAPALPGKEYLFATPAQLRDEYALPGAFRAYLPFMGNE